MCPIAASCSPTRASTAARATLASTPRRSASLEIGRSPTARLASRSASSFRPKPSVGVREHGELTSAVRARVLLGFRLEQRKRRFVLSSCPRGVAKRLVSDIVEKRLGADGGGTGNRFEFDGIEKGQRLARILHHELDPTLRLPPLALKLLRPQSPLMASPIETEGWGRPLRCGRGRCGRSNARADHCSNNLLRQANDRAPKEVVRCYPRQTLRASKFKD